MQKGAGCITGAMTKIRRFVSNWSSRDLFHGDEKDGELRYIRI